MHKWLLVGSLSVILAVAGVGLQSARAEHGHGGHCYSHHGHHGGYVPIYGGHSTYYRGYGVGYSPYAVGGYGRGLNYGSYYGVPGLSIGRSSYYSGFSGYGIPGPYGIGGYGYGLSRGPGLQLRIGF